MQDLLEAIDPSISIAHKNEQKKSPGTPEVQLLNNLETTPPHFLIISNILNDHLYEGHLGKAETHNTSLVTELVTGSKATVSPEDVQSPEPKDKRANVIKIVQHHPSRPPETPGRAPYLKVDNKGRETMVIPEDTDHRTFKKVYEGPGGNGANVAVAAGKLGCESTIWTGLASTIAAETLQEQLSQQTNNKVDVLSLHQETHQITQSNVITPVDTEGKRHDKASVKVKGGEKYDFNKEAVEAYLANQPDCIYLTSLGDGWQEVYNKVPKFANEKGIPLAISPGSLQMQFQDEHLEPELYEAISRAQLLFVNKDEAKDLLKGNHIQMPADAAPEDIIRELKRLKGSSNEPFEVSMTDGDRGSYFLSKDGQIFFCRAPQLEHGIVDTTGAGDAYAAILFAALNSQTQDIDHETKIRTGMKMGVLEAASVIGQRGAQNGLLTGEQMKERLEHTDIEVSKISPSDDIATQAAFEAIIRNAGLEKPTTSDNQKSSTGV